MQNCTELPSPSDATGMKSRFAVQFARTVKTVDHPSKPKERIGNELPQEKLIVVSGLQYAVLAKNVKGVNDKICIVLRGVNGSALPLRRPNEL